MYSSNCYVCCCSIGVSTVMVSLAVVDGCPPLLWSLDSWVSLSWAEILPSYSTAAPSQWMHVQAVVTPIRSSLEIYFCSLFSERFTVI